MMKQNPARRRFVAAMALYLAWVGALAAMAITSASRPPSKLLPPATADHTPADRTPDP